MNQEVKSYIYDKLKRIPDKSGVYFMKDSKSDIIYIGKAKSLKKRVSSYFNNSNKDAKTTALVEHIRDIDYILTENEVEALILEAEMIRKHKPHYNILLKDQKSFPFIAVTNEHFPRVIKARNVIDKENASKYKKYYGPYVAAEKADNIVKFIVDNFKLRRCKYDFPLKRPIRPCLYHHIGKCTAPCANLINEEDYDKTIKEAIMVLEGNVDELIAKLKQDMFQHAEKLEFEAAKDLRDKIDLLKYITVEQSIYIPESDDIDIIGAYGENGNYIIVVLSVKGGKLIDRKTFNMQAADTIEEYYEDRKVSKYSEVISAFFTQYYTHANLIPSSISTDFPLTDADVIKDYLKSIGVKKVEVLRHGLISPYPNNSLRVNNPLLHKQFLFSPSMQSVDVEFMEKLVRDKSFIKYLEEHDLFLVLRSKILHSPSSNIQILSHYMSKEEYMAYFSGATAILLVYPKSFRYRVSGVLLEAISCGKNTLMSDIEIFRQYESLFGTNAYFSTVNSLIQCLDCILEGKNKIFNLSEEQRQFYMPNYSVVLK